MPPARRQEAPSVACSTPRTSNTTRSAITAITDSVPPQTLSGRHPMTAGGTQTGVESRDAGRSSPQFFTLLLRPRARRA
ncbi:uncharacterized protein BDR25DRAFT_90015 [Lindgomyces ingoldianus]|uniref:Uncharacterized protein n=1 Tax=Lindgomyces ingoldianus TaxID=673940 RepID=A0ACB6R9S9_9PLEO|nr:uncharacterized protein BDR25DRAFT_90015 [Lindgomyces ingoldianus]KAF2476038.1 hypothetical protein BDR25DRAFT_90015 [Lindgomyces ingoldianus]